LAATGTVFPNPLPTTEKLAATGNDANDSGGYLTTDPSGWTGRLEFAPYQAMTNGYHVPGRTPGTSPVLSIFQTSTSEEYFYCVELTPSYDRSGLAVDRMTPILDDVLVVYMQWDSATVIEEVEVVD